MKIYRTKTQADYNALMIELEEKGRKWLGGVKPTQMDEFKNYGKDTYIYDESGVLSFSDGYYFKAYCSNETLIEYKVKGANKVEKKCEKCDVEYHDNTKYCSMCGKKLVEDTDFKSGDIVASQVFSDGSFGLVRLNEDLTNRFTSVDGFWYTKRDCDIVEASFGVFKEDTRHATPEEITEYESALQFHKHGRDPFEVKKGDILKDDEGTIFFVDFPSNWKKESFTSGRYTFLKTAEEFNEWLGVVND